MDGIFIYDPRIVFFFLVCLFFRRHYMKGHKKNEKQQNQLK